MTYVMPSRRPLPQFVQNGAGTCAIAGHKSDTPRYVTKTLRERVFARDKHACTACGERNNLDVDHVIPAAYGGHTALPNLQTLCRSCNLIKGKGLTAAVWRKLHPEVRLSDLEVMSGAWRPGGKTAEVSWDDSRTPVTLKPTMRSLIIPEEHYAEMAAFLDRIRNS